MYTNLVKKYLESKNIYFKRKDSRDEFDINIYPINNLLYVQVRIQYFLGVKNSKLFKNRSSWTFDSSAYRFVIDKEGKEVVELTRIAVCDIDCSQAYILDENNFLLPNKKTLQLTSANITEHFRIENGKATLVSVLNGRIFDQFLDAKKILMNNWQLYDYEKGIILRDEFDKIFSEEICYLYQPENLLFDLLRSWGIDAWLTRKNFIDNVINKMRQKNLILGYKILESEKENIRKSFHTLIFMDVNGNFVSDLYYVDDNELIVIDNVTSENINLIFQQLKCKLDSKVDDFMQPVEKEKKDIFLQLLKEFEE